MSALITTTSTTSLIEKPRPPKLTRTLSLPRHADNIATKRGSSWREKLRARRGPSVIGNEKWRDATLSEEERWREWHKEKDAERKAGSTVGYGTAFYRAKGGWASWMGVTAGS